MMKIKPYLLIALAVFVAGCRQKGNDLSQYDVAVYTPTEASGFTILGTSDGDSRVLSVTDPWQGADSVTRSLLLLAPGENVPDGFIGSVVYGDAKRIVAMSSTFVAMLDKLGATDRIVGVSGIDYISNGYVQSHRERIGDVGNEENVDFETLVALDPDLVLIYGVMSPSVMEPKLQELGIPYIYIGDYLEQSPLGKAEWIVALGEIVGKRDVAVRIYEDIVQRYNSIKERVGDVMSRPRVMINAPYGDSWFMPSDNSYIIRLIEDAGGEYLFKENSGTASVPIDMEKACLLIGDADIWLNPGRVNSLDELKRGLPRFADAKVVREGRVYNNNARLTPYGGSDFYESGAVQPDVILNDMVLMFHPELAADTSFYYYKKLPERP